MVPTSLRLSQDLTINDYFTISAPGETEKYFGVCSLMGECEWLPLAECWYALTEKAKEIWKGQTRERDGMTFGRLYILESNA